MKKRRAKIELLTPDLDLSVTFTPGYDLLDEPPRAADKTSDTSHARLKESEVLAIALSLWELSGTEQNSSPRSLWREAHAAHSFEGGNCNE